MRRFTPISLDGDEAPPLAGNWEMRRNADEVSAPRDTRTWHVFLRQSGAEVSGSIPARRRRYRDAGGTLAQGQAGAQPLCAASVQPVRSDAER
jgi:hypothetical protein